MATYAELKAQAEELFAQAEQARKQEIAQVVADIKSKIQEYGLTAADLGFAAAARRGRTSKTRKSGGPVYRSPQGHTWTPGRGRKPNWLVEALGQGKTLEEFRVSH